MFSKVRKVIGNTLGWRTNNKIIVIESDDWGSIRMPSTKTFDHLVQRGFTIADDPYCKYDSLERNVDLERLFDVLSNHKDSTGRSPVITGLCLMANPDFELIREHDFSSYFYKTLPDTLLHSSGSTEVLELWNEGKAKRIFDPQFHGREHLNVNFWLKDLQEGNPDTLEAFNSGVWGVYSNRILKDYQAAFNIEFEEDLNYQHEVIIDGIDLFNLYLGYKPTFFVPTNGPFNLSLSKTLAKKGIKYILLDKFQKEPLTGNKIRRHFHYLGKRNKYGQVYMSRNVAFEPSQFPKLDNVNTCLRDISLAFQLNKPAVISTHRLNYIGAHYEENSRKNLKLLDNLLGQIIKRWPEVEFITSEELGDTIITSQN